MQLPLHNRTRITPQPRFRLFRGRAHFSGSPSSRPLCYQNGFTEYSLFGRSVLPLPLPRRVRGPYRGRRSGECYAPRFTSYFFRARGGWKTASPFQEKSLIAIDILGRWKLTDRGAAQCVGDVKKRFARLPGAVKSGLLASILKAICTHPYFSRLRHLLLICSHARWEQLCMQR